MKTIAYFHIGGEVFPDHQIEQVARQFLIGKEDYIAVGCELFITAARTLIAEKVIPHTEVQFAFRGKAIPVDGNGRLKEYPVGFCDTNENFLYRLLDVK
jgi:hypothetical protein